MAWRGTVTVADRFWAALPYILPIASSMLYIGAFVQLLPITAPIVTPIVLIGIAYYTAISPLGMFGEFLIFLALLMFVVRNPKIAHFIRYNTMQAMVIGIMMSLVKAIFDAVGLSVAMLTFKSASDPLGFVVQFFFAAVFVGAATAYGYSLFNVAQGKYAEIKWISDASYSQTQV
jgi:Chloroplast import apparatus Tic20-like